MMRKASRDVLQGFEVDVEHSFTGDGERYVDEDGQEFFETIMKTVGEVPADFVPPLSPSAEPAGDRTKLQ